MTTVAPLEVPAHPPLPAFLPTWAEIYDALSQHLIRGNRRGDLMILNYTQKAVYDRRWDHPAVKACRGLVVNTATGEVVALPFPKFFNFAEPVGNNRTPALPEDVPVEYTEKLDGALGICYRHPEGNGDILWTTRGSFDSEQGASAQEIWDGRYDTPTRRAILNGPYAHLTLLAEIISPVTKQIVKYEIDDLVLIGARNRFTGHDYTYAELAEIGDILDLPVVKPLAFEDITDTSKHGIIEGVVGRFAVDVCPLCDAWEADCPLCCGRLNPVYRLKFKTADYLKLHRIKSRCTPRRIARAWADGSLDLFLPQVPEEWRELVDDSVSALNAEARRRVGELFAIFAASPSDADRKSFALWVAANVKPDQRGHLFRMYDDKEADVKKEVAEWFRASLPPELSATEDE